MADDGSSPRFKRMGTKDRTSCVVTGLFAGMMLALVINNMLIGILSGILIGLGIEVVTKRGIRLKKNSGTLREN